jgi:glycolate dehydrogenase FAD-binding subunit
LPSVSNVEEASAALAAAHAESRRLRIGADLTTDGLNRILEHDPGDQTCTVEAGVRLAELQAVLAASGQRLSLDPPGDPTIGALLARNVSGPLRHRFGAPRDLVLGVTLVLGDGTIANAGGKVVKNVAGYDLARLVCGSEGRLALIARASFRLHPLPKATQTLVVETDDVAGAAESLLRSQVQPSALDVLHPGRVVVLVEGSQRAVDAQMTTTRGLVGGDVGDAAAWTESRERQDAALGRLRFTPGGLADVLDGLGQAVVRPAAGVAYVDERMDNAEPPAGQALVDRIAAELDPRGVLTA